MDTGRIERLPFVERILRFDSIDSTNTCACAMEESPRDGLFVVVARTQRAGRGQRGNTFYSDNDGGLWVSLVVPMADMQEHFAVNRSLAMAACDAVQAVAGVHCRIKWPNDIYAGERKLAGILLEAVWREPPRIVAGLGMNVNVDTAQFPSDIRGLATSLYILTGKQFPPEQLLEALLVEFDSARRSEPGTARKRYSRMLLGVGCAAAIGDARGVFRGVDERGQARLDCDGGARYFSSGPLRFVESPFHDSRGNGAP